MATHPPRTLHSVLVEPDVWANAAAKAERRGETVSDVIRRALVTYAEEDAA